MKIENRLLFFKYALPCAGTLIERGSLTKEEFERTLALVAEGEEPEEGWENIFKVAMAHLTFIAKEKNKDNIDDETIREYFLFRHDEAVEERFEEMEDFDPQACKTWPGTVRDVGKNAVVETPIGVKQYKKIFVKDLKVNDTVVVHRDFIVEKISRQVAEKMLGLKKNPKNIFS